MFILFWQPEMNTKKEGFTMKGIQRFISGWLAVCMVLSMLPMRVFATETNPTQETNEAETVTEETVEQETSVPVSMEPVTETVTVQIVPEVELPDNTELFAAFAERELYGYETATFGITARARLNAIEQRIYDTLKAKIETVALSGGSTVFSVSGISGMKTTWTDTEIDLSRDDAFDLIEAAFFEQFDLDAIVNALLSDCPFDLYWYDKTIGTSMNYWITIDSYTESGQDIWYAAISDMTFAFTVSEDYIAGTNTVTSNVAKVTTAKNNAASVVAANASKSDYEKLKAYKEYICDAVSYNHPAADNNSTPYGDPWQLISVFDGNVATEVVCEGYSKAFQYLCDLGGLDCISVSGTMTSTTGSGGHMWNVVTLDGKNYLVDVTNCDEGTAGAPDKLFLVGASYANGGYSFNCGYQTISFLCADLGLEEENYSESQQPSQPVTTYAVTVEASENGTVTASPTTAEAGTVITLTVTPAEGYALKSLTVKQGTADVTVTDNQFTMPAGDVVVTAEFEMTDAGCMGKHKIVEDAAVAPNCTDTGLTEGKHCSVCGEVLVKQEVVDALGHDWREWDTVDATCTVDGSRTRACKRSGCNETETQVILATGEHIYDQEVVDAKYLVSEATSTTLAVYRKSCKCGAAGEETFTAGELKAPAFTDVPENAYYYDPVMWAVKKGVTNGYGEADTFAPDIDCTRGQIVTFLWRAAGSPEPASSAMSFDDVEESDFYYKAVLWAVENGITNGYGGADTFAPNVTCTRGQVVTMLSRYLNGKPSNDNNPFVDVVEGAFYYDAVLWAAENGITTGTSEHTFEPEAVCTRGQIVTFLYRALYQHR